MRSPIANAVKVLRFVRMIPEARSLRTFSVACSRSNTSRSYNKYVKGTVSLSPAGFDHQELDLLPFFRCFLSEF